MEIFYLFLLLLISFVPAALAVIYTNQSKKRGCGRGCSSCGNREICWRGQERKNEAKEQEKCDD